MTITAGHKQPGSLRMMVQVMMLLDPVLTFMETLSSLVLLCIKKLVLHTFIQDKMVETGHRQPRLLLVTEKKEINSDILSLHQKILWSWVLIHLQTLFISLKSMLVLVIGN
jgi:hypothetical protein